MVTAYLRQYSEKVMGIIEFGGIPITTYPMIKFFGREHIYGEKSYLTREQHIEAADEYSRENTRFLTEIGETNLILNKWALTSFFLILNREVMKEMFEWRRRYPKNKLKLIAFGRRDHLFPS